MTLKDLFNGLISPLLIASPFCGVIVYLMDIAFGLEGFAFNYLCLYVAGALIIAIVMSVVMIFLYGVVFALISIFGNDN